MGNSSHIRRVGLFVVIWIEIGFEGHGSHWTGQESWDTGGRLVGGSGGRDRLVPSRRRSARKDGSIDNSESLVPV